MNSETYNKNQAKRFGWTPDWFKEGHKNFDSVLTNAIKEFQKSKGLVADGLCGAETFRVINSERESLKLLEGSDWISDNSDVLWRGDKAIKIDWPSSKVHTFKDLNFPYPVSKGLTKSSSREIKSFVTHWDVCLNSMSCAKVLAQRNVSVHFCIDNDGTIIQLHDLNDICWHAGNSAVNKTSIGVEISNAFYLKHQSWYTKNGFGERPIVKGALAQNSKVEDHLGFYPIQLEALSALCKAMNRECNISLTTPQTKWAYDTYAGSGKFSGFMNHFHCNKQKIDCAGLSLEEILKF